MPRKNDKEQTESNMGDYKQMILKVDNQRHSWIKSIAEETGLTQPNVVNLILGEASKKEPKAYIDQIKKMNAKEALKKLDEDARQIEIERKRLSQLLES